MNGTMRVLLTGIGGFIGCNTLEHLLVNTDWDILGIASWQHKGMPERILQSKHYQANKDRVEIFTHDLNAPLLPMTKKQIGKVDYIINMASDSHVDRSITDPVPFIQNNVNLCLNMLEYAREVKPEVFIQISTDETLGATDGETQHAEWSTILPSNPYAASKAAQEAIAISYWRTYGVPVVITNTMNNWAAYQDAEKYLPMCIRKIRDGETIQIHGNADETESGSRCWIHARNHADALLFIIRNLKPKLYPEADRPDRYNIVGEKKTNLELAQMIAKIMGKELKYKILSFHASRPGHDLHYGLSGDKLKALGWEPPKTLEESLAETVNWYLKNSEWL